MADISLPPPSESIEIRPRQQTASGVLAHMESLLQTIADAETHGTQHRAGRLTTPRTQIDYEYSVSVGLGCSGQTTSERNKSECGDANAQQSNHFPDQPALRTALYHTSETEYVATVDLSEVPATDLDAAVDDERPAVLLRADGAIIEQIPVPYLKIKSIEATIMSRILIVQITKQNSHHKSTQ